MGIQEIQMNNVDRINVEGCWDHTEFGHVAVQSSGRSGGLLNLWDPNLFNVTKIIQSKYFLITIGSWDDIPWNTIFAIIYMPQKSFNENTF